MTKKYIAISKDRNGNISAYYWTSFTKASRMYSKEDILAIVDRDSFQVIKDKMNYKDERDLIDFIAKKKLMKGDKQ